MKVSKKIKTQAEKILSENGYKSIYVNKNGEFFTSESNAMMSVDKASDFIEIRANSAVQEFKEALGDAFTGDSKKRIDELKLDIKKLEAVDSSDMSDEEFEQHLFNVEGKKEELKNLEEGNE